MNFCKVCGLQKKTQLNYTTSQAKSTEICKTELANASTLNKNKVLCDLVIDFLVDLMKKATRIDSPLYKEFEDFLRADNVVFDAGILIPKLSKIIQTNMIIAGNIDVWAKPFIQTLDDSKILQYQLTQKQSQLDDINNQIKELTGFTNLLPTSFVECSTVFVATLQLDSKWDVSSQFDIEKTTPQTFDQKNPRTVNMMCQRIAQDCIFRDTDFSMGILYTSERHIQLRLFMPSNETSIDTVLQGIDETFLFKDNFGGKTFERGKLILPRFKIESETDLTDAMLARIPTLRRRGCDFMDNLGSEASNFKIFTKVKFTVNESGATVQAAAAAGVSKGLGDRTLRFDRPFIAYFVDTKNLKIYASATYMQGELVTDKPKQTIVEERDNCTKVFEIQNSDTYIGIQVQYEDDEEPIDLSNSDNILIEEIKSYAIPETKIKIRVEPNKKFGLQFIHSGTKTGETQELVCIEKYISPDGDEEAEDEVKIKFNQLQKLQCGIMEKDEGDENDFISLGFTYTKTNAQTAVSNQFNFYIRVEFTLDQITCYKKQKCG